MPTVRAEVPMASQLVLAHPDNYGKRVGRFDYDLIVQHCTDGRSRAMPVAEMFATKRDKASSAHFVNDQDGTIIQCVPLRYAAFHAHSVNSRSVGIENCARTPGELGPDDPGLPPSSALYLSNARLTAWLLVAAGLPPDRDHVKGHAEADPATTHTRCPEGCGWNWSYFMSLVKDEYAKIWTPPPPNVA
jgi:N-acetyl-anhydromuramyl-L-alanine amidase AmpD